MDSKPHLKECDEGETLYKAVQNNDTLLSLEMLNEGVKAEYIDPANTSKWTMLHWASFHGNEKIVEALLNANAAVEYQSHKNTWQENVIDASFKMMPLHITLNTPLHRAAARGHLSICWLLLLSSYSVDDVDNLGNTPLHLAASSGFDSVVECFIEHGADVNKQNRFKLTPLDVATNNKCVNRLKTAIKNQSLSPSLNEKKKNEIKQKHIEKYMRVKSDLLNLIKEEKNDYLHDVEVLKRAISVARELGVTSDVIKAGNRRVQWIEYCSRLTNHINDVKEISPVVTPTNYQQVNNLEGVMKKYQNLNETQLDGEIVPSQVENLMKQGRAICDTSNAEYWLKGAHKRLEKIKCAAEENKGHMTLLQEAISKAEGLGADNSLIDESKSLLTRLISELELRSSYEKLPIVRLPVPEMTAKEAREYWQAEDIGHIEETEEYPLPPKDSKGEEGEYVWHESKSLASLQDSITNIETSLKKAKESGANDDLCQLCKEALDAKIENRTILEAKGVEDKDIAVATAQKEAKKLMKKKKKKGKKT